MKKTIPCYPLISYQNPLMYSFKMVGEFSLVNSAWSVHISLLIQTRLEKSILWTEDLYFSWKQRFKVKNVLMNLFLANRQLFTSKDLIDWQESCGLLWCFYQLFGLSLWRHPFTAEDPLGSKRWNANSPNLFQWKTNSCISWMTWEWVHCQQI